MESTRQAGKKHRRATNRPVHSARSGGDDAGAGGSELDPRIEHLRQRFFRFRATHPLRTRIPNRLRTAALEVVRDGATESDVRRACGVTSDQLAQWRTQHPLGAGRTDADEIPSAQVFPVTTSEADEGEIDSGPAVAKECVELRLGGLSISIRALRA